MISLDFPRNSNVFYLYKNVFFSIFIYNIHILLCFCIILSCISHCTFFQFLYIFLMLTLQFLNQLYSPSFTILHKKLVHFTILSRFSTHTDASTIPLSLICYFFAKQIQAIKKSSLEKEPFFPSILSDSDHRSGDHVRCSLRDHGHDDVCILPLH